MVPPKRPQPRLFSTPNFSILLVRRVYLLRQGEQQFSPLLFWSKADKVQGVRCKLNMSLFAQKSSTLLLLCSAVFFNCQTIRFCTATERVPHMGCHERGRATPTQTPNTHACCALGHSAALPAQESPRIGSPNTSSPVLLDHPSLLGFHAPVAVATERSETPPPVAPLRT